MDMINLRKPLELAKHSLEEAKIDFALIGGFALGAHGIHRATKDIDLLVDGRCKGDVKKLLTQKGFQLVFESDEVLQFDGVGLLDIVLANRPLSLEMIQEAPAKNLFGVPVVAPEGIIGLKIQAYKNDPSRKLRDLADIQELLCTCDVDLEKAKQYADLFDEWAEIEKLKP